VTIDYSQQDIFGYFPPAAMHQYGSATLAVIAETRMVEVMFIQVAERFAL
jgi:hypothetical protein